MNTRPGGGFKAAPRRACPNEEPRTSLPALHPPNRLCNFCTAPPAGRSGRAPSPAAIGRDFLGVKGGSFS